MSNTDDEHTTLAQRHQTDAADRQGESSTVSRSSKGKSKDKDKDKDKHRRGSKATKSNLSHRLPKKNQFFHFLVLQN